VAAWRERMGEEQAETIYQDRIVSVSERVLFWLA
jgi:hypothetical protein